MPELPEVETVRRGLAPFLEGARIMRVGLNRADLRFPFPPGFAEAISGKRILTVGRRAKFLLIGLEAGPTIISHLGMTGSYRFLAADSQGPALAEPSRYRPGDATGKHDHMEWGLDHPRLGALTLLYADPRRFGFIDLAEDADKSPWLSDLGPEPLGNGFSAPMLAQRFAGRKAPVKAGLLDQRVVAGLGNIYVVEALHRAHIHPETPVGALVTKAGGPTAALERLAEAVPAVLREAIAAGGSTLRDFRAADGELGYFQHSFKVYGREGEPCPTPGCTGTIARIVQSGRSSFFCPVCQKRGRQG
ncbi:DNA-(apurinic or apyrimidinic site) lyase [Devosia enhydra]|uniref:Formamidopyrimidine-DNA glycosylase n=1 Tax=Devosia enhydra TaxID=665118 RepID=A0A1K2HYD3_9HYPH|nr:bifunctional DNA-formamidopyrimidine glycosylase/DNA-(apurinic or apyrimidinic site) lyase [Devosia enhydra]SFZ84961.1 DNA-(apurinic or apyrimidinic site) lyase [Devosia enhydra]